MWTHLENWLVQDGGIPELSPGAALRHVAVRAVCWCLVESEDRDGVVEQDGPDPSGEDSVRYRVTGTALWSREPGSAHLRVGELHLVAEPNTVREVRGKKPEEFGLEPYSPHFAVPRVGARVTALCTLKVMADYRTEAFDVPDLRRDWVVHGLKIQRRDVPPASNRRGSEGRGKILSVEGIPCMRRWDDDDGSGLVTYLLDLRPADSRVAREFVAG